MQLKEHSPSIAVVLPVDVQATLHYFEKGGTQKILVRGISEYFRLLCYCGMNDRPLSMNLPDSVIALARLLDGQPAAINKCLGRTDRNLSIADGFWSELVDLFRGYQV
jgi:hypothetical protein